MTAPRIGLVLGGGGLTGTAFHAGVVAGLAEFAGWDARAAEVIVGTSAGSTSAALLRAGLPPADFVARMAGAPMSAEGERVLGALGPLRQPHRHERPARRPAAPGLLPSIARRPWRYRPGIAAAALLPEGNLAVDAGVSWIGDLFEAWPEQPTWICTVRLDDGVRVVFGRDANASVRDAVTASCAIPGYFTPVVIDGPAPRRRRDVVDPQPRPRRRTRAWTSWWSPPRCRRPTHSPPSAGRCCGCRSGGGSTARRSRCAGRVPR